MVNILNVGHADASQQHNSLKSFISGMIVYLQGNTTLILK